MADNSDEHTIPPQSSFSLEDDRTLAPSSTGQVQSISEPSMSGLERFASYDSEKVADWQYGSIYQATHRKLSRQVRLVVLSDESRQNSMIRKSFIDRVQQIAKANVANIHAVIWEAVDEDDIVFIACEPPSEASLSRMCLDKSGVGSVWFFDNERSTSMIGDLLQGLVSMHELGIIHGSISKESLCGDSSGSHADLSGWLTSDWMSSDSDVSVDDDLKEFSHTVLSLICETERSQFSACGSPAELRRTIDEMNTSMSSIVKDSLGALAFPPEDESRELGVARELASDISRSSAIQPSLANWMTRVGTLPYEAMFAVWLTPFLALITDFGLGTIQVIALAWGLFLLPSFVWEVVFKANFGRKIRGLHLLDRAGGPPSRRKLWQRWLVRSASIILFGLIGVGAILVASAMFNFKVDQLFFWACFPVGLILTYCTAFFLPHRRPVHDFVSRITLGRLESKLAAQTDSIRLRLDQSGQSEIGNAKTDSVMALGSIDQYRLESVLGVGGMGMVYSAFDETIHRKVAIKVISANLEGGAETLERFEREAMLGAQLSHGNIAKVFGTGRHEGAPYLAMEHIEGKDLKDLVYENGPILAAKSWDYITQAARGLKAVDDLGIIHRDIKPANLMVDELGTVKVMDFGVSKQFKDQEEDSLSGSVDSIGDQESTEGDDLTVMGALVGTPMYMSPEQASAGELTAASDIYSLGLTLWTLLAGKTPFESTSSHQLIAHQISDYPSMQEGLVENLTSNQTKVLRRMIAKEPQNRYSNYDELLMDLEATMPKAESIASADKRMTAVLLTTVPISVALVGVFQVMASMGIPEWNEAGIQSFAFFVLFPAIYIFGIWKFGQTPGKWMTQIKVVRVDGRPLTFWTSIVRYFASVPCGLAALFPFLATLLPAELSSYGSATFVVAWLAGLVFIHFHSENRAPHDLVAGTKVVVVPKKASLTKPSKGSF